MSLKSLVIAASVLLVGFSSARAEGKLDIGAQLWSKLTYEATKESAHKTGFDIDRMYLILDYKIDETWSSRLLLDGTRGQTEGAINNAKFWAFINNLYVQGANLWAGNGTMRFGYQFTPYYIVVDGLRNTRWLTINLADQTGALNGVSGGVALEGGVGSYVKYSLFVHNGLEGLDKAGAFDNRLATTGQITVTPFTEGELKGLTATVVGEIQTQSKSSKTPRVVEGQGRKTVAAATVYNAKFVDATAELVYTKVTGAGNARIGYGVTANVKFMDEKASIFGKFFSGNDAMKTNGLHAKWSAAFGPTYSFVKGKVMTALLWENTKQLAGGGNAANEIQWKWAVNF